MGGGRYSTNNRVNAAAAAAAAQRAAALASGPAYPEKVASLASPFETDTDPFAVEQAPERFTYQTGDVLPEGYRSPAKFFSDMTSDEQRANLELARLAETGERTPTTASTSGLSVQDFGAQPTFGSPDEALANYGNVFNTLKGQEERVNKVYNYNNFDPGDFGRTSVSLREGSRAAGTGLAEYVQQNDIPLSKVIDGERKYLTTGNAQANAELWPNAFQGGDLVATGPAGTYSTTFRKDDNLVTQVLNDPIIGVAASFIPGGTLAITGAKAAAGIELSPIEIATGLMAGLNATGLTAPPTETMLSAGQMGPNVANTGTGLFGTTYAQTATAINVASAGDIEGAALNLVMGTDIGKDLVTTGLEKIGLDETTLTKKGIQPDDFRAGVDRAVQAAVGGADLDEALLSGFSKYVREGGTLDIPLGGLEDVIRDIVRPIGEVGTALGQFVKDSIPDVNGSGLVDTLKDLGSSFDDAVLQPTKEVIETAGKAVDANVLQPTKEVIETAGKAVDANVLQPTKEVIEAGASVAGDVLSVVDDEVIQPVIQGVEEGASVAGDVLSAADTAVRDAASAFDDAVIQPVGDALSALDTAVRQALPDINLPDIDLPDVNLPRFNLDLGGLLTSVIQAVPQPAPNRTTDSLFKDELFQFQTEIGADVEPIEYVDLGFSDPFQDQTLLQRYPF